MIKWLFCWIYIFFIVGYFFDLDVFIILINLFFLFEKEENYINKKG